MIEDRTKWRLRGAFAVLVVWLALFGVLTIFVWALPSRLDEQAIIRLAELRTPDGTDAALIATRLGDRWSTVLLTTAAALALVWSRRRASIFLVVAVAGAGLLNQLAKWTIERPRPSIVAPAYDAAGLSFPSGHSMASFALFFGFWLVARHENLPHARATLTLALVVVPIVGFTRSYLGVHYPTDVLAGWALSGAWLTLAHTWYVRHPPWAEAGPEEPEEPQ